MQLSVSAFKLGDIDINVEEHKLINSDDQTLSLQPKFVEVLVYLATQHPRLISRDELIENVWAGNVYVGEKALTNAIWHLRQSFRKLGVESEVIETVRKSGYKLLAEPTHLVPSGEASTDNKRVTDRNQLIAIVIAAAIIIPALVYFAFFVESAVEKKPVVVSNVTREPGREIFPAVSRDNRYLAFKWIRPGKPVDLFIKDLTQPDLPPKQVTFDELLESAPVWSADGKQLYFARKIVATHDCEIVSLNLEHKNITQIDICPWGGFTKIDVSKDGRWLAYTGRPESKRPAGIYLRDLNAPQKPAKRITCIERCNYRDRDLAFSPDGRYLAVNRRVDNFNENIYLINLDTMATTQLTEQFRDLLGIAWHPDGERIVFGSQYAEKRQGYVIDINSKKLTPLNVPGFSFPHYSTDEKLYYHDRAEKYQISAISMKDDQIPFVEPVIVSGFSHMNPDYSVQSKQLAYVSNETGNYEIWLANADGSHRKRLTYLNSDLNFPAWSHDGKKIAFKSPRTTGFGDQLNFVEVETGKITPIKTEFRSLGRPSWSLDDSKIYSAVFMPNEVNIFSFKLDSTEIKKVTQINGRYLKELNENTAYFSKYRNSLWRLDLKQTGHEELVLNRKEFGNKYVWDMTEKGIYFYRSHENQHQIEYYEFATGKIHDQFKLPWLSDDQYGAMAIASDINKIFLTQSEFPQADIKILQHPLLQ